MAKKIEDQIIPNEKYISLISEVRENRSGMYTILDSIKDVRSKLNLFIPMEDKEEKKDFRNQKYSKFLMQEGMKNITAIIQAELDVRKTIEGSVKTEFDLTSKANERTESKKDDISAESIMNVLKSLDSSNVRTEINDVVEKFVKESGLESKFDNK